MRNALTIDVEEYFHVGRPGEGPGEDEQRSLPGRVEADVTRVLELLDGCSVRATFFVLGEVAAAHPSMIAGIAAAGHEVSCHGYHHVPVDTLSRESFAEDLDRAIGAIERACGRRPAGYRAPIWSLARARWAFEILVARGFSYDSSLVPVPPLGSRDLPSRPTVLEPAGGRIVELPPLTGRLGPLRFPVGFGLGLRLLPTIVLRRAIAAENRAGQPALFAFHPWELDPDPPSLRLAPALAVAHGFGTDKLRARLEALLGEVPFGPVSELLHERAAAEEAA